MAAQIGGLFSVSVHDLITALENDAPVLEHNPMGSWTDDEPMGIGWNRLALGQHFGHRRRHVSLVR